MTNLSTQPELLRDSFDWWQDDLFEGFSEDFWNVHEEWVFPSHTIPGHPGQCEKWSIKLHSKGRTPTEAAKIIERAFLLYKLD